MPGGSSGRIPLCRPWRVWKGTRMAACPAATPFGPEVPRPLRRSGAVSVRPGVFRPGAESGSLERAGMAPPRTTAPARCRPGRRASAAGSKAKVPRRPTEAAAAASPCHPPRPWMVHPAAAVIAVPRLLRVHPSRREDDAGLLMRGLHDRDRALPRVCALLLAADLKPTPGTRLTAAMAKTTSASALAAAGLAVHPAEGQRHAAAASHLDEEPVPSARTGARRHAAPGAARTRRVGRWRPARAGQRASVVRHARLSRTGGRAPANHSRHADGSAAEPAIRGAWHEPPVVRQRIQPCGRSRPAAARAASPIGSRSAPAQLAGTAAGAGP